MNSIQDYLDALQHLTPELWLVGAILIVCLWNLFFPKAREWSPVWSLAGLSLAALSLWEQFPLAEVRLLGGLYTVDRLTVSFGVLVCIVGFIVVLMTMGYEHHLGKNQGEFYTILLTAVLAVMILAGTTDLVLLFVGLETLSLCCVILSGFAKRDAKSNEAALKYLLSTAATTATFLYGLSFVYGLAVSTNYYDIHAKLTPLMQSPSLVVIFLMVLLLSAIGFKLSTVPFHMWTPDVYEGAPTPVTAFLSIGSKAGGLVVALRLLTLVFPAGVMDWSVIMGVLAVASMVMGNLIALAQTSFKRMLAYSSIAHIGYILIGLVANNKDGLSAMMFYIIVYGLMNLGAFACAILFSNETGSDNINDYAGLLRKRPWLAIGLSVCLLNLAGLPIPPAGFFAKLFVFWSGVHITAPVYIPTGLVAGIGLALVLALALLAMSGWMPKWVVRQLFGLQLIWLVVLAATLWGLTFVTGTFTIMTGWLLVGVALVTSVPAVYYYSRVVIKMIVQEPSETVKLLTAERKFLPYGQVWPVCAVLLCVLGILLSSVFVDQFMAVSQDAVSPLTRLPTLGSL
ncbi:MAG: NADH-quinone oxidoreductase subunit NuoN [Candidatus Melainabacteria bacterium]|nr:NADH-quinone oxidoreductase subunit NuoN [Candidatus Melainabacteria bacterium]